jgi:hypothetical protein
MLLTVVPGLVGGAPSSLLLRPGIALAQTGAQAEVIEAQEFRVVDAVGNKRVLSEAAADGGRPRPADAPGKVHAVLGVTTDASPLSLCDASGCPRAVFGVGAPENSVTGDETRSPESSTHPFSDTGNLLWNAP